MARLKSIPTFFLPRIESREFCFLDHTTHNRTNFHAAVPLNQGYRLPRDCHTLAHGKPRPGGANGINLIATCVLSGKDVKSKGGELRVREMSSTSTGGVRSGHHGWKDKVRFHLMGLCVLTPLFSDRTIHIDISFFWLLGESPIVVAIPMPSAAKARECRFLRQLSYQLGRRKLRHPSSLTCRRSSSGFLPGRDAL